MRFIVIGAGPAGSLAAILLARAGMEVTLIEQSRFPRDKVCGECLSALGRSVLQRHDLESALLRAGAVELTQTQLVCPTRRVCVDLPKPMLGISRSVLDQSLLDHARSSHVKVLQPWRVEGLTDAMTLRVRDLSTNTIHDLSADHILVADGRGGFIGTNRPTPTGDLGIKTHYTGLRASAHTITLYTTPPCYGGVAPIENGRWNAAFSVPANFVKNAGGNIDQVFQKLIESNALMQQHFAGARRVIDWIASPLPRYLPKNDWPGCVTPIGNAAGAIEPIGGEGMGLALRSAELAVDAILHNRRDQLPSQYRKLWQTRSLFCRLAAVTMSHRWSAELGVDLLDANLVGSNKILSLLGK